MRLQSLFEYVRIDPEKLKARLQQDGGDVATQLKLKYHFGTQPENFAKWLDGLNDIRARARILVRIERLAAGNPGDVKPVGEGVSELRIDYGPGYRVYYKKHGRSVVILLAGGVKRTQSINIKTALRLAKNL